MQKDLNPLTTPATLLTDCLNGTIVTFNGAEFTLQNDLGNCKVDKAFLKPGFIPMGMKDYAGIIYVASYNPITNECEFGSFPSPQEDFSTTDFPELSPVEFTQTEFILENNITHEKVTNVLGKLFEPELFMLHPGDKYVITYTINEPAGGNPSSPTTLDTKTKYENYISKDILNRKLFRLSFYQISSSNNLSLLDASKINVIQAHDPLLDVDYAYFTGNSKAALAVGLEIEPMDFFNANVIDTSLRTDSNKKIAIEGLGESDSLSDFVGVKVVITEPSSQTFYLQRHTPSRKVSAIVNGFSANDEVECSVTPYSAYCLFPKLTKNFKLTLGQFLTVGSGINNLFRYYMDPAGFMQVDFDYRFQGNTPDGIHLYVEFYDPWSDYSIIKTVDNPTYYGTNTVILELVDEPIVDQYDGTTIGGTSPLKLITNPDTDYEKTLLNSTNKIRTDQSLRKNHFYIVRVSGVDKTYDATSGLFTYQHYDFYKGMYTNDMFNDTYLAQGGLSVGDNGYVGDFNALDFEIGQVKYGSSVVKSSELQLTPVVTTQRDDLTTGGQYYYISSTVPGDLSTPYKYTKKYETTQGYNISLTIGGLTNVFGFFKNSLLSITAPTVQASDGTDPDAQKPVVTDAGYDGDSLVEPETRASWTLTSLGSNTYSLASDFVTKRSISAPIATQDTSGVAYKELSLLSSLHYRPTGDTVWNLLNDGSTADAQNPNATVLIKKYDLQVVDSSGTTHSATLLSGHSPDDGSLVNAINAYANVGRTYSALVAYGPESTWGYGGATPYNDCNDHFPWAPWKHCNLLVRTTSTGFYHPTKTIDLASIVDFFTNLMVASNVSGTVHVYYPNGGSISANGNIVSTATYPDLEFMSNLTPNIVSSAYVRTWLSTFRMHATGALGDFKAATLNTYINTRKGSSVILDGKQTLRDGFIPFIDDQQQIPNPIAIPAIVITQAADSAAVTRFVNGVNEFSSDPSFAGGDKLHGTLFTTKPESYGSFIANFVPRNVTPGTEIVETGTGAVYVEAQDSLARWSGHFAFVGRCKDDNSCPTLIPSLEIIK
jgi:hypothetical protein